MQLLVRARTVTGMDNLGNNTLGVKLTTPGINSRSSMVQGVGRHSGLKPSLTGTPKKEVNVQQVYKKILMRYRWPALNRSKSVTDWPANRTAYCRSKSLDRSVTYM